MCEILNRIRIEFLGISTQYFLITAVITILVFYCSICIDKKVRDNKFSELGRRVIEFCIFSISIIICFVAYGISKYVIPIKFQIIPDIIFPITTVIIGNIINKCIVKLNGGECIVDKEFKRNRNALMILTLICLIVVGNMGFLKSESFNEYSINYGALIASVTIGRFCWFDTDMDNFTDNLVLFLPTKAYLKQIIIPIGCIFIFVLYVIHMEESKLYGVFWGLFFGCVLGVLIKIIRIVKNFLIK